MVGLVVVGATVVPVVFCGGVALLGAAFEQAEKEQSPRVDSDPGEAETESHWKVRSEVDPMTDQVNVYARTVATVPIRDRFGAVEWPSLSVRCQDNKTDVIVDTESYLQYESRGPLITLRFDDGEPKKMRGTESTSKRSVFLPSPISQAKRIDEADKLLIEWTPNGAGAAVARFDVSGSEQAIATIREACHW